MTKGRWNRAADAEKAGQQARVYAEEDMARYFEITPPSAHQMVVTLEQHGLIERVPGQARSIRVLLPREELPDLE